MTCTIRWVSTAILVLTVGRTAYGQWKQGSTADLSECLFVGQLAAASGFVVSSWLLHNYVVVVSTCS